MVFLLFYYVSHDQMGIPIPPSHQAQTLSGGSPELREVLQLRVTSLAEELMKHDVELQVPGGMDGEFGWRQDGAP